MRQVLHSPSFQGRGLGSSPPIPGGVWQGSPIPVGYRQATTLNMVNTIRHEEQHLVVRLRVPGRHLPTFEPCTQAASHVSSSDSLETALGGPVTMQRDHPSLQPRLRPTCWSGGRRYPVCQPGFLEHSSLPSMQRGGSSGSLGARVVCEPAAGLGGRGPGQTLLGAREGPGPWHVGMEPVHRSIALVLLLSWVS